MADLELIPLSAVAAHLRQLTGRTLPCSGRTMQYRAAEGRFPGAVQIGGRWAVPAANLRDVAAVLGMLPDPAEAEVA